jgi:uncharacterized NAD(P)/FAD-binding protein YdhS
MTTTVPGFTVIGAGFGGRPIRLGLDGSLNSAVVDRRGGASPRLYALGPVTRGIFWEITSVPDSRQRCCWKVASHMPGAAPAEGADPA